MTSAPGGRRALVGGRIVLPDRVAEGMALVVLEGRIAGLARPDDLGSDVERIDLAGGYAIPGMIDLHTHGALRVSFLDGSDEAFDTILREQLRHGVTGALATTSTAPLEQITACLERVRAHAGATAGRARLLGAHVEGPYFAAAQAGAQDPAHLRNPDDGSVEALLEFADAVRILSFAPELPGALSLTRRLVRCGIVPAAGHSSADDADVRAAEALGLRHVIHLWSGQSTTTRRGPWRVPGLLEAALASSSLTGEVIADGKHLPPTLLRLAWRTFGSERLCLVSDATSGAGLAAGTRFHMGGMEYEVHDGVGMMLDRSAFAGSTCFLDHMVRVMTREVGVPLAQAVRMASLTPAQVIGVDDRKGSLVPGKDADVAVFDPSLAPQWTMMGGQVSREGTAGREPIR